jgi:hypothetical protein
MKKLTDRGTDGATVSELACGAGDEVLWAALTRAGKAGIDRPLGWPSAFVSFVTDHQAGQVTIPGGLTGQQWRRQLAWRLTDEVVRAEAGLIPLSASSRCQVPAARSWPPELDSTTRDSALRACHTSFM